MGFVFIAGMVVDAAPACVEDPKLEFQVGKKKRNCKWVSKDTKSRCKKKEKKGLKLELKVLCPATCDHCPAKPPTDTPVSPTNAPVAAPACVEDPKLEFKVGKKKRNCKWVSKDTKSRCKKKEKKGL